jgi:hypothetical protein
VVIEGVVGENGEETHGGVGDWFLSLQRPRSIVFRGR